MYGIYTGRWLADIALSLHCSAAVIIIGNYCCMVFVSIDEMGRSTFMTSVRCCVWLGS